MLETSSSSTSSPPPHHHITGITSGGDARFGTGKPKLPETPENDTTRSQNLHLKICTKNKTSPQKPKAKIKKTAEQSQKTIPYLLVKINFVWKYNDTYGINFSTVWSLHVRKLVFMMVSCRSTGPHSFNKPFAHTWLPEVPHTTTGQGRPARRKRALRDLLSKLKNPSPSPSSTASAFREWQPQQPHNRPRVCPK